MEQGTKHLLLQPREVSSIFLSEVSLVREGNPSPQIWGLKWEHLGELGEHHTFQTKKLTFRLPPAHGHRKIFQHSHKQISALFFLL